MKSDQKDGSLQLFSSSGFVVKYDGRTCLIMTCKHSTNGARHITVLLPPEGTEYHGAYEICNDIKTYKTDLALVKLDDVVGDFRPFIFADPWKLTNFREPVYLLAYFSSDASLPGRSPGRITGMSMEHNAHVLHATFTSEPGTSGGPVVMGDDDRVVGVNQGAGGGSRLVIPIHEVHAMVLSWCGFYKDQDYTIDDILQKLLI